MKNNEFFYRQYDKINWQNQEKTKINFAVNKLIIDSILSQKKGNSLKLFDIGFGTGFFFRQSYSYLSKKYPDLILAGCEPSRKNFEFFKKINKIKSIQAINLPFQEVKVSDKFDFVTAIYVFPHFSGDELEKIVEKIRGMLITDGKFVLVVANQKYIKEKLDSLKDLFLEKNKVNFNGKTYSEVLHYSEIPQIGKVIDYNREERFYEDLFSSKGLKLISKKDLNDKGFICTLFVFEKQI